MSLAIDFFLWSSFDLLEPLCLCREEVGGSGDNLSSGSSGMTGSGVIFTSCSILLQITI